MKLADVIPPLIMISGLGVSAWGHTPAIYIPQNGGEGVKAGGFLVVFACSK